ncbi:MAG: septum site-determining protein MinC [Chloroflexi bacterium]|nr:septum site-determining protein MinC [Chloroflexota bacterium]
MSDAKFEIKGVRDGLLIIMREDSEWQSVITDLTERIDKQASFFTGAKITVNLGSRPVPKYALGSLKAAMERRHLALAQVLTDSPTTKDAAEALDLRTAPATVTAEPDDLSQTQRYHTQPFRPEEDSTPGMLFARTLRSGRIVRSDGHVVVIGDVNPGAEIIAAGDVVVWGVLRGMVHAGAMGNTRATVCALEMAPTQLRIADRYSVTPKDKGRWRRKQPEIARIDGEFIIVEAWQRTARKE